MRREVFGDTSRFALEIQYDLAASNHRVVVGSFFYWVAGQQVGDGGYDNLSDVFKWLTFAARDCGQRDGSALWPMSASEILHWFIVARFWRHIDDAIDPSLPQDATPYDLMFDYGVARDPLFLIAHGERARVYWFPDERQPCVMAEGEIERFEGAIKDAHALLQALHDKVGFGTVGPAIVSAGQQTPFSRELVAKWPRWFFDCPPIDWHVRETFPDRWLRIHSLPLGKRYPTTRLERRALLERHVLVSNDVLGEGSRCMAVLTLWDQYGQWPERQSVDKLGAAIVPGWEKTWTQISLEAAEALNGARFAIAPCSWHVEQFIELILDVAFDVCTVDPLFVALDTGRVYAPYDGGADLIVESPQQADEFREKYAALGWTPPDAWP